MDAQIPATIAILVILAVGFPGALSAPSTELYRMTMYWIAEEGRGTGGDDGTSRVELRSCDGELLAVVNAAFAQRIRTEGTGRLASGRILNLSGCDCAGGFNCFMETQTALGSRDNPLVPFVSVASKNVKFGTRFWIEQLAGMRLPDGRIHNGCVRVDDYCPSCGRAHLDLFIGGNGNYGAVLRSALLPDFVDAERGSLCSMLDEK